MEVTALIFFFGLVVTSVAILKGGVDHIFCCC